MRIEGFSPRSRLLLVSWGLHARLLLVLLFLRVAVGRKIGMLPLSIIA